MSPTPKKIEKADILSLEDYAVRRKDIRQQTVALKKPRRIDVGPFATFYFENYHTMLRQVQEMLYIEKGGDEQLADELAAYNPMIPQGSELTATLMFEIDDPVRRNSVLYRLADVELTAFIQLGDEKIYAVPDQEVERTTPDGKTSSVHFLHFPFTPAQITRFKSDAGDVIIGMAHENYAHMTLLQPASRASLAADFD